MREWILTDICKMLGKLKSYAALHKIPILLVLGSMFCYTVFGYHLQREDFPKLLLLFAIVFILHFKLIQFEKWNFKFLLLAGVLFRLVFLLATPNLSQDFYRFVWDGELIIHGINPYLYTPNELIENPEFHLRNAIPLHSGMGELSAKHYSNYPPINQFLFALSSLLGMGSMLGSIVWMRILIIAADMGILYYGKKVLQNLNLSPHVAFWYFLNPLVIIELTGNLHFEGTMLFFFVWALYLISEKRIRWAAPVYAASIMVKLVPMLFLPLFLKYLGFKKSLVFYTLTGICCLAYILPFHTPELVDNYSQTIALWFSNFEFNASIYNLVKRIAISNFDAKPWELIKTYGTFVKITAVVLILLLTFLRKHKKLTAIFSSMLIVLTGYYLLSSTVHPWYLIFLLGLSLFTRYRFSILWTGFVILSYYAYSQPDFKENLWLLFVEYFFVIVYLGYEIMKNCNILARIRKKS